MVNILEQLGVVPPQQQVPVMSATDKAQLKLLTELRLGPTARNPINYGAALIQGLPGAGKTTIMVYLAYLRKKFWGYPVVSNLPLKSAFGDYDYLDTEELISELLKINEVLSDDAKAQKAKQRVKNQKVLTEAEVEQMDSLWSKKKIKLHRVTWLWDESPTMADARRGMSPTTIMLGYLSQQFRHYESMLLVVSHHKRLVDQYRVEPFMTHDIYCTHHVGVGLGECGTSTYSIGNRHIAVNYERNQGILNPQAIQLCIDNWIPLFDSFAPIGIPKGIIKGLQRENSL